MTQPIYARDSGIGSWSARRRVGATGCPSRCCWACCRCTPSRHAEFLHNEVPGITIPDRVRAAMAAAGDRGAEVGLELAAELLEAGAPAVAGTYVMPSFGRYEQGAELVRRLRARRGLRA